MLLIFAAVALDALFSAQTLAGAHVGALVVDAGSGNVLYARHASDAFIPASTMKLIVGSTAIERLGDGFSFVTSLAVDGQTLYIKGGGDTTLAESDVDDAVAATSALDLTPRPVKLVADVSRYRSSTYPDGWQVDDLPFDYAAPVSALSYADNVIHLALTPGSKPGDGVRIAIAPASRVTSLVNLAVTGPPRSEDTSTVSFDWNHPHTLTVTGSVPLSTGPPVTIDAAALDPVSLASDAFTAAFDRSGMQVERAGLGVTPPSARSVWEHRSARLPDLLRAMWQPSDNLLAETLLEELGAGDGVVDTRAHGIDAEKTWLHSIGIDPNTLTIADGSGMSAYDRVTPQALVLILEHDWNGPHRAEVLAALPVAGKSGTLEDRFKTEPLAGNVIAKTGTSNHTRTLAGYLQTPHGTLIFALLVNDWMDDGAGASARLHAFQEAFLEGIRQDASGV